MSDASDTTTNSALTGLNNIAGRLFLYDGAIAPSGNLAVSGELCVVSLLVPGCAGSPTGNDTSGLFGQNVVGNEAYVTVSNVYSDIDALLLVDMRATADRDQ
jgi:hypothetical protein